MSDDCEYQSNPRLRVLSEELRILNEILIKRGLSDQARIFQMRDFAQASKHITGVTLPELTLLGAESDKPQWTAYIDMKSVGAFDTPRQAIEAYKAAHVEKYGIKSQYHPEHPIDDTHLYGPGDLPCGVSITEDARYKVTIGLNGKATYLGVFKDLASATEAIRKAKAKAQSGKFRARHGQECINTFDTPEDASAAYEQARAVKYERERAKAAERQAQKLARAAARAAARATIEAEKQAKAAARAASRRNPVEARAARSTKTAAERQARAERYGNTPLSTGVRRSRNGRFQARIKTGKGDSKVEIYLGTFDTPEEASAAYQRAHAEYHGEVSPHFKEATND